MKKFIEEKSYIVLVTLMIIGLMLSIFKISTLNNKEWYKEELNVLYLYEEQITENFDKLYEIEKAKLSVNENKYIVTICSENYKLELNYTKEHKLISEEIIPRYSKIEYIFPIMLFSVLLIPVSIYLIIMAVLTISFTIMDFVKNIKTKKKIK